jgi:high-affinity iron transporter
MVIYMQRVGRHLRTHIGEGLETAAQRPGAGAWLGVFLFVVLMITRDGMEMALITATLVRSTGLSDTAIGALLGAFIAAALGWAWVRYGQRINLGLFFQVTSLFLVLFAAQLVLYSFHELTEAGALPFLDNEHWHDVTEPWVGGTYGAIITYALVVVPVMWLVIAGLRGRKPEISHASTRLTPH